MEVKDAHTFEEPSEQSEQEEQMEIELDETEAKEN